MLYVAVLAHGALLAIPGGPEEEVPPEIEEIEEIDITMLAAIVEPVAELEVEELPPDPPPAPEPDPIPPPAETLPQPEPAPIQEADPVVDVETSTEEGDSEDGEAGAEGEGPEAPVTTTESLDNLVSVINTIIGAINREREATTQIELSAANNAILYSHPGHYFVDPAKKFDSEYKDAIISHQRGEELYVPAVLSNIDPDDFYASVSQAIQGAGVGVEDVSNKLSEYNPDDPSRNDILVAIKKDDAVIYYLALARPKAGKTTIIVPFTAVSFSDASDT